MSDAEKVLFILPQPFFQWRGSPIRAGFDLQALAESGYQVDLLTLPVGEDRQIDGVNVIRVPNLLGVKNVPIGPSVSKALFDIILLFKALSLARKNRYAVIHGVEDAGAIGVFVAKVAGSKLVYEKHSDPSAYKKGALRNFLMRGYAALERFIVRRADAVIGTGEGLVAQTRAMAGHASHHHIFDIPSSLVEPAPERTDAHRKELAGSQEERLVMFVGSFAVYQGVDLMFESVPEVVKSHPEARFVIVGGTPGEIEQRKQWLTDRNCEDSVTFAGKIPPDDLPHFLAAADILLSPRLSGVNTPLKLLDYLKAESAIVATDTDANRLILDETIAVLAEPKPPEFARAICNLLDDPLLRKRLAENGRRLIDDTYNFQQFKKRLAECYETMLR
jgi:glycosyltransferase involved in cell wall biosynthesis